MIIYFDTSALAKLILAEPESANLRQWIADRPDSSRITNVVGVVELQRLAARVDKSAVLGFAAAKTNRFNCQ